MRQRAAASGSLVAQLHAGADAELREHLVQVPLDGARAEEEPRADLLVRLPVRGEPRDLLLLRRELAARLVTPFAHLLAGREQLAAGALGERLGAEADEHLVGGAELLARVHPPVLTPQPLAVDQVRAAELRPERRAAEPVIASRYRASAASPSLTSARERATIPSPQSVPLALGARRVARAPRRRGPSSRYGRRPRPARPAPSGR